MDNIEHVIIYCDSNKFIASLKQVLIYFFMLRDWKDISCKTYVYRKLPGHNLIFD